jgi:ABC-type lipoprotein release transport system permease subunit
MHPVTVLFSLILWGFLWGLVGAILAVPLTSIIKIWISHIDHPFMKFLTRLMDGNISTMETKRHPKHNTLVVAAAAANQPTPPPNANADIKIDIESSKNV